MLKRLRSLYSDWKAGRGTDSEHAQHAETDSAGDDVEEGGGGRPAGAPDDGASSAELTDGGTATPTGWEDLLDGETVSKQDVQVELGLQPHEFLAWLVRSSGGRMWQADMVETTGWSKSTVSRYLDTLESNQIVERVQIGRRKLVGVPDEMPTGAQAPESASEKSVAGTGSWNDEAA